MLRNQLNIVNKPMRIAVRYINSLYTTKHNSNAEEGEGRRNATLDQIKQELEKDKEALKWRKPIGDSADDWYSKFKLVEQSEQTSDFVVMMQQPISLNPKAIKEWWKKKAENKERFMQQYVNERIEILGVDLGAAHFILYRGGSVKFLNSENWLKANENNEFDLPSRYNPDYKVEALRCDNMTLYYEGLENLRCLQYLKLLSFRNVATFDDWCLDRVSGSQYPSLEILDISGTNTTYHGLSCLYRIPSLQLLIVDDPKKSIEYELSCAMLEEALPNVKVISAAEMHSDLKS